MKQAIVGILMCVMAQAVIVPPLFVESKVSLDSGSTHR